MSLNPQNQDLMFVLLPIQSSMVRLGISDHSLICATRKLNSVFKRVSRNSVEFRTLRNLLFKVFSMIYNNAWVELDNKQNVDEMWECWKT